MLSATPVNTSLIDLRNQVHLMTEGREGDFQESLGVGSVGSVMAVAQREFKQWEGEQRKRGRRDKTQLLERLGPDFLRLLDGVSIARSRRHITQFYAEEMTRIGQFPQHARPVNAYPLTDLNGELSYKQLAAQISRFQLSIYRPSDYLVDADDNWNLKWNAPNGTSTSKTAERFLVAMMRTTFLKRLESSPRSLTLTLERTIQKIDALLDKIDRYESIGQDQSDLDEVVPDDEEEDDDFSINRGGHPYHLGELDLARWRTDMLWDRETLAEALADVTAVTPERDGKLQQVKQAVRERVAAPTTNMDGKPVHKMLVFTTFKDTAEYVYEHLSPVARELGIEAAMVSGDVTHAASGRSDFNSILTNFAPRARNRRDDDPTLTSSSQPTASPRARTSRTATPSSTTTSTGTPSASSSVSGRIDRIGSRNRAVHMLNYWPTDDMEAYLKLESRVIARMALVDTAASGGDDPFNEDEAQEGAQLQLNFRDEQLKRLRDEILDLDDLSDNIVMSDFTMDYFLAQLRQYLEKNKTNWRRRPRRVRRRSGACGQPWPRYPVRPAPAQRLERPASAPRQPRSPLLPRLHQGRRLDTLRLRQCPPSPRNL